MINLDQKSDDVLDGGREKIETRRKLFQLDRPKSPEVEQQFNHQPVNKKSIDQQPNHSIKRQLSQGKQFKCGSDHQNSHYKFVQNNRSKKQIGKRKATPLYSNYEKLSNNQVDEIFIILKDEGSDNEEISGLTRLNEMNYESSTHLICDSFNQASLNKSTNELANKLTYQNLNDESLVDFDDESSQNPSHPKKQTSNQLQFNRSSLSTSSNKSLDKSSIQSSNESSNNELDKNDIDNHGIQPVRQMIKHWMLTKDLNESNSRPPVNRRATVQIPSCSNTIKSKRAIFEQRASLDNKENRPKSDWSTSDSLFRRKLFTVWSDKAETNSNETKSNVRNFRLKVNNQANNGNESKANNHLNERKCPNDKLRVNNNNSQSNDLVNHHFKSKKQFWENLSMQVGLDFVEFLIFTI